MRMIVWFLLSCKRQLKHVFFVILLILMPLALLSFQQVEKQDSGKILIGVFSEDREMVPEIIDSLLKQDGMFEFYVSESEDKLKEDVITRYAECGFVFADNFKQKLDDRKFKRSIIAYNAPSSIMHSLSKEVVFASVIEVYGQDILKQFIEESELFEGEDKDRLYQELQNNYGNQTRNGTTFSFRYETLSTQPIEESVARIAFPVRGMLAIYLFVIGIFSAVSLRKDEQKGLFIALPFGTGFPCKLAVLAAPVFLAGISAWVTLIATGNHGGLMKELIYLFLYMIMILVFSYVLKVIVRDPVLLCGLIPVFILASFVICPVFFDFGQWVPGLKPFRYLLLPYYYMSMGG